MRWREVNSLILRHLCGSRRAWRRIARVFAGLVAACVALPAISEEPGPPGRIVLASLAPGLGVDDGLPALRQGNGPGGPSLPEMIGQMLLVSFPGTRPEEAAPARVVAMIRDGRIGGVVLLYDNIVSPPQVRALNAAFSHADGKL